MVDCGNLRCFQERRSIKKELLSWSKKIPLVVGLEAVAEQVGSRRKVKKLFEPFNCLESAEPQDWEPEENCFYCRDRIQLLFDAIEKTDSKGGGKILRDHPSLRHLGEILPFCPQFYTSNFGRDILSDIKTGQNEVEAPPPPPPPPQPQPQSQPQSQSQPQPSQPESQPQESASPKPSIELKVPHPSAASKQKKDAATSDKKPYSEDDLSAAMTEVRNGNLGTRRAASLYGIPRSTLRNKVSRLDPDTLTLSTMLTEDDDCSSTDSPPPGQQLQGVGGPPGDGGQDQGPELPAQLKQLQASLQQSLPNTQPLMQLSELLQFSSLQQYLSPFTMPYFIQAGDTVTPPGVPTATADMMSAYLHAADTAAEWEKKLQHIRHKHNLQGKSTHLYREKAHGHKLKPYQYELIRKLTKERLELEKNGVAGYHGDEDAQSLTHSIILKSLEQNSVANSGTIHHIPQVSPGYEAHSAILKALNGDPLATFGSKSANVNLPSKLVIPSYNEKDKSQAEQPTYTLGEAADKQRPYDGLFKYENTRIGDTLKDIIVKTISEKVRCKLESTDFTNLVGSNSELEKRKAKQTILSAFSIPEGSSPPKKIKREPGNNENVKSGGSNGSSNANSTQTKKTRPKRGQYRKYNSQLLTEAVKAVQRGEMSVHRAGSYYGVPHSTLEYKVKERHLLRQKKIKDQQEQKLREAEEAKKKGDVSPTSKPPASEQNSASPTKASTDALNNISSQKPFPGPSWLPPFVGPSPFENAAALGLFGSGFSLSTPASELLRKLQHKVQSKSDSGDEDSSCNSKFSPVPEDYVYIS